MRQCTTLARQPVEGGGGGGMGGMGGWRGALQYSTNTHYVFTVTQDCIFSTLSPYILLCFVLLCNISEPR